MNRTHNISNLSPLQLDMKKDHELMFGAIVATFLEHLKNTYMMLLTESSNNEYGTTTSCKNDQRLSKNKQMSNHVSSKRITSTLQ